MFFKLLILILMVTSSVLLSPSKDHYRWSKLITEKKHCRIKRAKAPILYYHNSISTVNLILSGDTECNPGPGFHATKCTTCNKVVKCNQKRLLCDQCFKPTHAVCVGKTHFISQSKTHLIKRVQAVSTVVFRSSTCMTPNSTYLFPQQWKRN